MKPKMRLHWCLPGVLPVCLLFMVPPVLAAEEGRGKTEPADINNVGFMKNPPEALRKKFPMCDAFLSVKWIDKKKKIGFSRYDFYKDGRKFRKPTWALVHLDIDFPTYDYNLEKYQKQGRLEKIFSFIKEGEVAFETSALVIEHVERDKIIQEQFGWIHADWDEWNLTLAEGRTTVCIPYPDNQRMYLAELKKVGKIYGESELAGKLEEIRRSVSDWPGQPSPLVYFRDLYALDLNFDLKEDYFSYEFLVYSYRNGYQGVRIDHHELPFQQGVPPTRFEFTSPTLHGICEVAAGGRYYLTTDGANFYINNQCNLTSALRGK